MAKHKIIRSTPFGAVAIVWSAGGSRAVVIRVFLSGPRLSAFERISAFSPDSCPSSCAEIDALARDIQAFLHGDALQFSLDILRMDLCSSFQRSVLLVDYAIPRGRVSTYGVIAEQLHRPYGARAVGAALANNPFPIIIPCHRVVRSDRTPGGYQGGLEMKRALLEAEGITLDGHGRVPASRVLASPVLGA
jgi:methylated-DNA-[protein]-cysteine S-methyltransferase